MLIRYKNGQHLVITQTTDELYMVFPSSTEIDYESMGLTQVDGCQRIVPEDIIENWEEIQREEHR